MARRKRIAFVTVGQAPRTDMVPEILERLGGEVEAQEFGALDDLSRDEIAAMHPPPGEPSLATRLRDGSEVVIGKRPTGERLQVLFNRLDKEGFDAITLLCTGYFPHLESRTLLVESQRVVDATVDALALGCRNLGVMVPLKRQIEEFHLKPNDGRRVTGSYYSPYAEDRLEQATRELKDCDLIVMHCMGYSEAMRARAVEVVDKPVLLARRIVAGAVQQLL
jgi:protein AroM